MVFIYIEAEFGGVGERECDMKRKFAIFLIFSLLICLGAAGQALASDISIGIDGDPAEFDARPEIKNNAVFVPIRPIAEKMGAAVTYSGRQIKITGGNAGSADIMLTLGKAQAVVQDKNGSSVTVPLTAAPYIKNNRTMLPLRFVSEQLGCNVEYQPETISYGKIVRIILPGKPINGEAIFSMRIENNPRGNSITISTKDIVNTCIDMIYEARCEAVDPPKKYTPLGSCGSTNSSVNYNFYNRSGELTAKWQFAQGDKASGGQMYLHDMLNDCWYLADSDIYYRAFEDSGGTLELKLTSYWGGKGTIY